MFCLVGLGSWSLPTYILLAIGAAGLVYVLFKRDDRKEQRRKSALRAAAECRAIGDDVLARVLESYSVGDYSGVVKEVHAVIQNLIDVDGVGAVAMRAKLVAKILPALLEDPTHRSVILKVLKQNESLLKSSKPSSGEL